jgi:hypothetical protein
MSWKDKAKGLGQKGQELKAEYDRRQAERAEQAAQAGWGPASPAHPGQVSGVAPGQAPAGLAPVLRVTSHDEGRNALVTLYPDRIERVKDRAFGSLSRARQDTEVIPIKAISSVQAKKKGIRTNVTVFASGNTVEFRIAHQEAQRFKDAVMQLVLAGPPITPSSPTAAPTVDIADQIRRLADLRDQGLLTNEEFDAKKKQILGL